MPRQVGIGLGGCIDCSPPPSRREPGLHLATPRAAGVSPSVAGAGWRAACPSWLPACRLPFCAEMCHQGTCTRRPRCPPATNAAAEGGTAGLRSYFLAGGEAADRLSLALLVALTGGELRNSLEVDDTPRLELQADKRLALLLREIKASGAGGDAAPGLGRRLAGCGDHGGGSRRHGAMRVSNAISTVLRPPSFCPCRPRLPSCARVQLPRQPGSSWRWRRARWWLRCTPRTHRCWLRMARWQSTARSPCLKRATRQRRWRAPPWTWAAPRGRRAACCPPPRVPSCASLCRLFPGDRQVEPLRHLHASCPVRATVLRNPIHQVCDVLFIPAFPWPTHACSLLVCHALLRTHPCPCEPALTLLHFIPFLILVQFSARIAGQEFLPPVLLFSYAQHHPYCSPIPLPCPCIKMETCLHPYHTSLKQEVEETFCKEQAQHGAACIVHGPSSPNSTKVHA